jgi:serine/threonine-protein kinase
VAASGEDPLRDRLEAVFGRELVVEREIGRGAMGAVFAAFDPALQRRVAVKSLLPEVEMDSAIAERFMREARIAAALQHANIVSVYGVRSGDGVRAIVMQYVEGRGLDRVLAETPLMAFPTAAKILADVAGALQHAHDRRVIHRDIKPANVLLGYDGRAMVTDFGIARQFGATRITEEGLVMGTLPYISPEGALGTETSAASDQYSLGVMAFEMCVGVRPFRGSVQELLHAHAHVPAPSVALARPELPVVVAEAIQRMLAKDPRVRWPNVAEVERLFRAQVVDADAAARHMAQMSQPVPRAGSAVMRAQTTRVGVPAQGMPAAAELPATVVPGALVASAPPPTVATRPAPPSKKKYAIPAFVVVALLVAGVIWKTTAQRVGGNAQQAPAVAPPPVAQEPAAARPAPQPGRSEQGTGTQPRITAARGNTDSVASRGAPVTAGTRPDSVRPVTPPPVPDSSPPSRGTPPSPDLPARPAAGAAAPPLVSRVVATDADGRRLGNEFASLINRGRWRELETLASTGGDAAARANLIRLVRASPDVSAGLQRYPSLPLMTQDGFESELILDLQVVTGGKPRTSLFTIVISGKHDDSGWHLAGWRVTGAP